MVFMRRSGGPGEGRDIALCEECAKVRGIVAGKSILDIDIEELLGSGLEPFPALAVPAACPKCGMELSVLLREGRLSCSSCADAFAPEIAKARGKLPPVRIDERLPAAGPLSLSALSDALEAALSTEDYEKAAVLRDELGRQRVVAGLTKPDIAADFPFARELFGSGGARDDDVVLWSSARVYRNLEDFPFPGSSSDKGLARAKLLEGLTQRRPLGGAQDGRVEPRNAASDGRKGHTIAKLCGRRGSGSALLGR